MAFDYKSFRTLAMASQDELLKYFGTQFPKIYGADNVIANDDYVFAKGDIPIMLIAHLDTVHKKQVELYYTDTYNGIITSPQGIGGDDRCGVYAILKILGKVSPRKPYVLFTTNEESGMSGATKAAKDLKDLVGDVKFLVEIDRKGEDDCVFYSCGNEEFKKFIETFGFKTAWGSASDISRLAPAWNLAATNLSSGYYNAHSKEEFVMVSHLEKTINRVVKILNFENPKKYDYSEKTYAVTVSNSAYWDNWDRQKNYGRSFNANKKDDEIDVKDEKKIIVWNKSKRSWGYWNSDGLFVPTTYGGRVMAGALSEIDDENNPNSPFYCSDGYV